MTGQEKHIVVPGRGGTQQSFIKVGSVLWTVMHCLQDIWIKLKPEHFLNFFHWRKIHRLVLLGLMSQALMTEFLTLSWTSTSEIPTLLYSHVYLKPEKGAPFS